MSFEVSFTKHALIWSFTSVNIIQSEKECSHDQRHKQPTKKIKVSEKTVEKKEKHSKKIVQMKKKMSVKMDSGCEQYWR